MGAVDRLRSAIAHLRQQPPYSAVHTPVASRSTIMVDVDDAEALCDLHDLAKDIYPFLDAVMYPLRDASYFEMAGKVSLLFDSLGEILSRLEDREEGGS